jgi:phage terminase small subunit
VTEERIHLTDAEEAYCAARAIPGTTQEAAWRKAHPGTKAKLATIKTEASRLERRPHIQARINALKLPLIRKHQLNAERVSEELARLAFFNPKSVYREDGSLIPVHELEDDAAAAVASIEHVEEFQGRGQDREQVGYTKKLKFWDKNSALDKAMRHLGMFEKDNAQQQENLRVEVVLVQPKQVAA